MKQLKPFYIQNRFFYACIALMVLFVFSFVFPKNRGANSKCIPKDIYGWCAWAESVGVDPKATKSLLEYNQFLLGKD